MPKERSMHTNELQIQSALRESDEFQFYLGDVSSMRRNTQGFEWSKETLNNIIAQLNAGNGIGIYPNHNTYREFPIGKTVSSKLVDGKARTELYIQRGLTMYGKANETDDLIKRMNALTVDSFSTGTMGGDFVCDLDGSKFEYKSDGMFFYTRKCDEGHRLNQKVKWEGKEQLATATVKGEVTLFELSVVGNGAVPDAKIIKQLQEKLSDGTIEEGDIPVICQLNNFYHDALSDTLGIKASTGDPTPNEPKPYIVKGREPMNQDLDLLERQNTKLEKDNGELTTETERLETELADLKENSFTQEEYDAMTKERDDLKTENDKIKGESKDQEESAKVGKDALKWARAFYVEAEVSAESLDAKGESDVVEYVSEKTDFITLVNAARGNLKKAARNRAGGKKAIGTHYAKPTNKLEDGHFGRHVNEI